MAPSPEENDKGPNQNPENDPIDIMDAPNFIIDQQSSDSEEEEANNGMNGYQILPQDPYHEDSENESNDTEEGSPQGARGPDRLGNSEVCMTESDIDEATLPEGLHTAGGHTPSYMQVPDLPRPLPNELLWNQSHDPGRDISLDSEQSNKIKLSMSKITLPQNNIPEWAKDISDDQWKEKLQQIRRKVSDN